VVEYTLALLFGPPGLRQGLPQDSVSAIHSPTLDRPAPSPICRPHVGRLPCSISSSSISPSSLGHVLLITLFFCLLPQYLHHVLYLLTAAIPFEPPLDGICAPGFTLCLWLESHAIEALSVCHLEQPYLRFAVYNIAYRRNRIGRIWPFNRFTISR
jgi:hypothetical protein